MDSSIKTKPTYRLYLLLAAYQGLMYLVFWQAKVFDMWTAEGVIISFVVLSWGGLLWGAARYFPRLKPSSRIVATLLITFSAVPIAFVGYLALLTFLNALTTIPNNHHGFYGFLLSTFYVSLLILLEKSGIRKYKL